MTEIDIVNSLAENLTDSQLKAVQSEKLRVLVVAGAGSGKTEVMARRIAWWVGVEKVPKEKIVAFTFTERAAEEMKFRIRKWIERITPSGEDVSLGTMYIGTIHGFCLAKIREFWPDEFHNYDVLDESARTALILREFNQLLALRTLRNALSQGEQPLGQYATLERFLMAYDQLHEHNLFEVELASPDIPYQLGEAERNWCRQAQLLTDVGEAPVAQAFAQSAARYYAYLKCRRFLDFSTSQTEFIRQLQQNSNQRASDALGDIHLVVDEVQDINPVQLQLIELLIGDKGKLTTVGDHRQSIYGFRGAKVEIIAKLWEEFSAAGDAEVVDLQENFRSTARIIEIANNWSETISPLRTMTTPSMRHGNKLREDHHTSHVATVGFSSREEEAEWIGRAIQLLVPSEDLGVEHDKRDGSQRGLAFSDIAVLVRTATDIRKYMTALEASGIPAVVRAGPDLFSQPEILFFTAALAITAGQDIFMGSEINPRSLPRRIQDVLGCEPRPEVVLRASAQLLRNSGLIFDPDSEERVLLATRAICNRINGLAVDYKTIAALRTPKLREFLSEKSELRRVFPQRLFHYLLSESGVEAWDTGEGRGQTALFHLGALSSLITGIEMPGWTSAQDYRWQIIGLCQYGAQEGRVEEQPLIVSPNAVTISTIHAVKGLEFPAVFLADVCSRRFPNQRARQAVQLPMDGQILQDIDVTGLSDNENYDGERRLMYVALTRAERFLFFTHSGRQTSRFINELTPIVRESGGVTSGNSEEVLQGLKYLPKEYRRDIRLSTSFSDLRYYLECPHDFYLRKVLGFSPTIDQAFGYGRGVHNLLRAIHSEPKKWADYAKDRNLLEQNINGLIEKGLFYLRYTTGEPAENMRKKGLRVVADYVKRYVSELEALQFEPEKQFETLVEYEDGIEGGALVSGAIDVVRQDQPPRVTLIDFKSGEPDSDKHQSLDEREMKLQVAIYGVAAKKELEYQPERGLVRYLGVEGGERSELEVPLHPSAIDEARSLVAREAAKIRDRHFVAGPPEKGRCGKCDFLGICGMPEAQDFKKTNSKDW